MPADTMLPPERLEKIEALYAGRQGKDTFVDYEIKVYKGIYFLCPLRGGLIYHINSRLWYDFDSSFDRVQITLSAAHGFGARPNFAYADVKEGFEKAFQQAVDWFNKTVPA
jgi:hypothetical protein